jgi:hypothetical protein
MSGSHSSVNNTETVQTKDLIITPSSNVEDRYPAMLRIRIRDPHVFGPPGSGSITQRYGYGSGSGSGSFSHHAKIVRKTLLATILQFFLTFNLLKKM